MRTFPPLNTSVMEFVGGTPSELNIDSGTFSTMRRGLKWKTKLTKGHWVTMSIPDHYTDGPSFAGVAEVVETISGPFLEMLQLHAATNQGVQNELPSDRHDVLQEQIYEIYGRDVVHDEIFTVVYLRVIAGEEFIHFMASSPEFPKIGG